jgi:hypothetical protein
MGLKLVLNPKYQSELLELLDYELLTQKWHLINIKKNRITKNLSIIDPKGKIKQIWKIRPENSEKSFWTEKEILAAIKIYFTHITSRNELSNWLARYWKADWFS